MVESNQPSDSQLRKIKIKQLQGSDIELQVNKDVSNEESHSTVFRAIDTSAWT